MEAGETRTAEVDSREEWNATGIRLNAGEQYHFRAEGEWIDWTVTCDADGYDSINFVQRHSEPLRRVPSERWFVLIGSIGREDGEVFRIGTETTYSPRSSGELFGFANDVSLAYWNNHGTVRLTVTRLE